MKGIKRYLFIPLVLGFLLPAGSAMAQQEGMIQGRVEDVAGRPVGDAIVTIDDSSQVRTTVDQAGRFELNARLGQHLRVTAEGYTPETVVVSREELIITLQKKAEGIPVGYGLDRSPETLTSAVGRVQLADVTKGTVINPGNALYGRIPGLTVLQNGGMSPTQPDLLVRGRGTFTNSAPLILVDGFERPLSSVWMGEIEQVAVLKDAAALAKYGQRGANGVVLITTKRGGDGELKITASSNVGLTRPTALPDFLGAPSYARALNEARANDGRDPLYSPADLRAYEAGESSYLYPNINWFNEVLRDQGVHSNVNLRFRGGGSGARYFTALNYVGESGLFGPVNRNEGYSTQLNYRQLNLRSNLDIDLTDNLLFQVDVTGSLIENNRPGGGSGTEEIFNALYTTPSAAFPVRTPSGRWGGNPLYSSNPLATLTATGYSQPNARDFSLKGRLHQNLSSWAKGLSTEGTVRYYSSSEFYESNTRSFSYSSMAPVRDQGGAIVDTAMTIYGQNTDLNFSDSFGTEHQFADVVGELNYVREWSDHTLETMALFHQSLESSSGQDNTYHRRNFVLNAHLGWGGRYFFDATASYSGSNLLPSGSRYKLFPAVSAGWLFSEEAFLQDINFLDRLKVRASWGMSGSDRLPANNIYEKYYNFAGGYYWGADNIQQGGVAEGQLATNNLTYETSYKTNVGLEAMLFRQLSLTADLFYDRRTNILTSTEGDVSEVIGNTPRLESEGVVENRGFEAALDWESTIGEVGYHIGGQFSFAHNEIVEMSEEYRPFSYLQRTGQPVGQWFGLEAVGFFEDEEDISDSPEQVFSEVQPGDIKYKDQNGDGVINQNDEVPLGHASGYPEIYFSASVGLRYKGFQASALFQGTGRQTAYLNTPSVFWPLRNNSTISTYYYDRRWTPESSGAAALPRLTAASNSNNFRPNSIWLADRSYIKLRTLEISYTLPASVGRTLKVSNLRLIAQGMNLFSIDDIPMVDPEHLETGYPILRSYSVGLEVQF